MQCWHLDSTAVDDAASCLVPRALCLLQPLHIMSGNRMLLPLCTFVAAVASVNMPWQEGEGERGRKQGASRRQHNVAAAAAAYLG